MGDPAGFHPDHTNQSPAMRALWEATGGRIKRFLELRTEITTLEAAHDTALSALKEAQAKELEPLLKERNQLATELYGSLQPLIDAYNAGKRFVELATGRLSFKKSPDKLEITDKNVAVEAIRRRRWATICLEWTVGIKKDPLKGKLTEGGRRATLPGTAWVDGQDLLYIDRIKIEPPDASSDTDAGEETETDLAA